MCFVLYALQVGDSYQIKLVLWHSVLVHINPSGSINNLCCKTDYWAAFNGSLEEHIDAHCKQSDSKWFLFPIFNQLIGKLRLNLTSSNNAYTLTCLPPTWGFISQASHPSWLEYTTIFTVMLTTPLIKSQSQHALGLWCNGGRGQRLYKS